MNAYTRAKCAREQCTRRGEERNKAQLITKLGTFIIYLCNRCYAEFDAASNVASKEQGGAK